MAVAAAASLAALVGRGVLRREGLDPLRRTVDAAPTALWITAGLGLFLVVQAGAGLVAGTFSGPSEVARMGVAMTIGYVAGLAGLGAMWGPLGDAFTAAGLRARSVDLLLGAGAFAVTLPLVWTATTVTGLLIRGLTGDGPPEVAHSTLLQLADASRDAWWWLLVGSAVVGAPIVEEVTYRGLIQTGLRRLTRRGWPAVVVTSALFTLAHVGAAHPSVLPGLFVLSLGLGAAFERTGRIGAPIVMHASFNAFNVVAALVLG